VHLKAGEFMIIETLKVDAPAGFRQAQGSTFQCTDKIGFRGNSLNIFGFQVICWREEHSECKVRR
jgi:hypothetical protein